MVTKKKEKKRKKVICLSSFSQNAQLYILVERKKKRLKINVDKIGSLKSACKSRFKNVHHMLFELKRMKKYSNPQAY